MFGKLAAYCHLPTAYRLPPSALVEVLVVRQDQPLVGQLAQVLLHPYHLIMPGGRFSQGP